MGYHFTLSRGSYSNCPDRETSAFPRVSRRKLYEMRRGKTERLEEGSRRNEQVRQSRIPQCSKCETRIIRKKSNLTTNLFTDMKVFD